MADKPSHRSYRLNRAQTTEQRLSLTKWIAHNYWNAYEKNLPTIDFQNDLLQLDLNTLQNIKDIMSDKIRHKKTNDRPRPKRG